MEPVENEQANEGGELTENRESKGKMRQRHMKEVKVRHTFDLIERI